MDSSPAPPYLQGENKGPVASDQLSPTPSCPEFFLPGRNTFVCASPHFPQQDGAPRGNRSLRGMEDMGGWKPWGDGSHRQTCWRGVSIIFQANPESTIQRNLEEAPLQGRKAEPREPSLNFPIYHNLSQSLKETLASILAMEANIHRCTLQDTWGFSSLLVQRFKQGGS